MIFDIRDNSHVGESRRHAVALGKANGLGETQCGNVGIVATELANNLLRHAGGGQLVMEWIATSQGPALELVSIDRGAGMADVDKCLQDDYTTAGTPGTGLGAIRRLSGDFDIYSVPGQGTIIVARIASAARPAQIGGRHMRWGVFTTPATGEAECGDIWRVDASGEYMRLLVCDGLGHGPSAAIAAGATADVFAANPSVSPAQFLEIAHRGISGTRGAAAAAARVRIENGAVEFAGIGNIAASIGGAESRKSLFSHNGTLGVQVRKVQSFDYTWPVNALLIMHSDGIQSRWSLDTYPGLQGRHPAIIAALLARDFKRGHDDVTVLVARLENGK